MTYGFLGTDFFKRHILIPIHTLKGIFKTKIINAIVIKGGGSYGYKPFTFYFHESGVLDKRVFDRIVGGNSVKYVDMI
jgi:hypothetical protein